MPPEAHLSHCTPNRIRIKIPSQKGNSAYFQSLGEKLIQLREFDLLRLNSQTGSILIQDPQADVTAIADYARDNGLFDLKESLNAQVVPLSQRVAEPLGAASAYLRRSTGGLIDLPGAAFLLLFGFGILEIVRGNLRSPPWYTAFWYAFGVFTKSLADMVSKKE
jgi:hypothetical protein